ncbi:hypothetical protein [Capnocytophaga gingivalis]|jgi:hypothetical protein|uniref:Outer membrane protein beta-barrel domain-containing protein n=1 Tax=Capnocytophaga gingivalis TaxID=1017 RepID=A0ABU5ZBA7_9FLAO|nr:hypothetical protein [Capnocytophaga gingivalis]MEB3076249.1 hypothetical protein [Capnocytophaga gingivalis]
MKRIFLLAGLLAACYTSSAQVYVSATGGYAWGVPSTKIGEESINGTQSVRFGTFGEGINSQLRVGYFFNKTWGVDVSVGYLYGSDQTIIHRKVDNTSLHGLNASLDAEAIGRGRAYGAALSVTYNFTDNFYGRFGFLTKIGGRTEVVAHSTTTIKGEIDRNKINILKALVPSLASLPPGASINSGATIETSYTQDYKGKMPFGTIAALGYNYHINEHLAIFAELEYMNIAVKRDYSDIKDFNQTLKATLNIGGQLVEKEITLSTLNSFKEDGSFRDFRGQSYQKHIDYVESATEEELSKPTKELTEKASYSSLGLNFGIKYTF